MKLEQTSLVCGSEPVASLDDLEQARLETCERRIERGLQTFVDVGEALLTIRDDRLYRATHGTFEAYCEERWGITVRHGQRLMEAVQVVRLLEPTDADATHGSPLPTSERQARELAPLKDDPKAMRKAWNTAVEHTEGKPTAEDVRREVEHVSQDTAGTLMRRVEEEAPDHAERIRLSRVARDFAAALHAVSVLPLLDPHDVVAACSAVEVDSAAGTLASAVRWAEELKQVSSGALTVVPGGGTE